MRDSLVFTVIYVLFMWAALALLKDAIIFAFSSEGDAAVMIEVFCYFVAGTQIFMGFLFVANAAFNNLDHPVYSTAFNWGRATLGVIPFAWYGSQWGPQGIIIGWGIGGAAFGALALIVCFRLLKTLPAQAERDGITVEFPATAHSPFTSGRNAGF
jgi:Na+-driven multidrug efflux pump